MLGSAVRASLVAGGTPVMQLVRRAPREKNELEWHPDLPTPIATPVRLEGIAAAIHLSGANVSDRRWTREYRRQVTASRVNSTYALARALAGLRNKPQVLLVASASGYYGDRGEEWLTESSAAGKGFLPDVCRAWEEAADPARQAGIRVVHLRFGVVLGRDAGALGKMAPLFRAGLGGRLGSGRQWMSWISLVDAVGAVIFLAINPGVAGPVNLVSPQPVRNSELTRALGRVLHRPAILPAPAFALRLAFGQMADEALLASARVKPLKLEQAGFRFQHPLVEDALRDALA